MSQASSRRRDLTNGFAKLGNSMGRPRISGIKNRSIQEAMAAAARTAARIAASNGKKKSK